MMQDKLLSALSLCRKAGKLAMGFDPVKDSVFGGKAWLVLLASDLSPKTAQRVRLFCEELADCAELPLTMEDLSYITRKPTGVLAVTDQNLAKLCRAKLAETAARADAGGE